MSRGSIRYIDTSFLYGQQAVAAPVSNPVVYGRFPKYVHHKKSSVEKLNKFLSMVLLGFVLLSLVSYYFVSDGQKTMNSLGREIVALNSENIELQNKLDNLRSFNKVESIMQGQTMLNTAKKVIEIPAVNMTSTPKVQPIPVNYNWSIGY